MRNIELSDRRRTGRDLTVVPIKSKALRWDLCASSVAALSVILVISGGLLILTAEMRSGWVSDHEVQMDKAVAIHKLLFRR